MKKTINENDLRVIKTKENIKNTFNKMIIDMDYKNITVKELTDRAKISRKTFYLHYETIDDLLKELQEEIIDRFIKQDISYKNIDDIKKIIKYFFESSVHMSKLNEKLICSGSYAQVYEEINEAIMNHRAKKYKGVFSKNPYEDKLVFAYFASNSTILYRQWVKDGKKMSLNDLIKTATKIICNGLSAFIK